MSKSEHFQQKHQEILRIKNTNCNITLINNFGVVITCDNKLNNRIFEVGLSLSPQITPSKPLDYPGQGVVSRASGADALSAVCAAQAPHTHFRFPKKASQ